MAQAAYDISVFENREDKKTKNSRQNNFKVVNQDKWQQVTNKLSTIKLIGMTALILSLVWGVIYSQVQIVEISSGVDTTKIKI